MFGILEIILIKTPPGEPFLASQLNALSPTWWTFVRTTDGGGCLIFSWLGVYVQYGGAGFTRGQSMTIEREKGGEDMKTKEKR